MQDTVVTGIGSVLPGARRYDSISNRELAEGVMAAAIKSTALLVLSLLLNAERSAATEDALVDTRGWPIYHELLPHSQDRNKAVELFWAKPEGNGPFPVVLFIHGHQEGPRDGGEAYVRTGRLGIMARRGYVSAAVSQPRLWQLRRSAGRLRPVHAAGRAGRNRLSAATTVRQGK